MIQVTGNCDGSCTNQHTLTDTTPTIYPASCLWANFRAYSSGVFTAHLTMLIPTKAMKAYFIINR